MLNKCKIIKADLHAQICQEAPYATKASILLSVLLRLSLSPKAQGRYSGIPLLPWKNTCSPTLVGVFDCNTTATVHRLQTS